MKTMDSGSEDPEARSGEDDEGQKTAVDDSHRGQRHRSAFSEACQKMPHLDLL